MRVELLWSAGCPHAREARALVDEVARALRLSPQIAEIAIEGEAAGRRLCFPGSPTIRVDGVDVEPGWEPCSDCTPRCRVYATAAGLSGLPERGWVERALRSAAL